MSHGLILIVEDEPAIADTLTYTLKKEGFETIWKNLALDAKKTLDSQKIDCIIMDVGLPDQSGFELCRDIRKTHNTPILFLTARGEEIDKVVGLEIGADDYVVKPFSPREIAARVKALMRRNPPSHFSTHSSEPPPYTQATEAKPLHFVIDEDKKKISYRQKDLTLSRTEYKILQILISHPGRVYSRDQLMDLAWDSPESSLDRTVDAHIKNIRAELKRVAPKLDPIQTHRGLGYSLKEES